MSREALVLIGFESGLLKGIDTLRWAVHQLQEKVEVLAVSTIVQNNRSGDGNQLRVVVKGQTLLEPHQVVDFMEFIESQYQDTLRNMESLRCFLLCYQEEVCLTPKLTLPHPMMIESSSWLYCCWEVWRNYRHPVLELSLERVLAQRPVTNVEFFSQGKLVISNASNL